jgi:hypothetical protein
VAAQTAGAQAANYVSRNADNVLVGARWGELARS